MASMDIPIKVNLPDNWAEIVAEKLRQDEDYVLVTRCKDCKYYEADITANPWGICCHKDWITNDIGHDVDKNGWCYRAERRTDE